LSRHGGCRLHRDRVSALGSDLRGRPSHLSIYFAVSHFDISYVRGRFHEGRRECRVDQTRKRRLSPRSTRAHRTGNALLDGVLRSAQYLDAETFPKSGCKRSAPTVAR
jgi:polyisoprenoid-binding protein YceI